MNDRHIVPYDGRTQYEKHDERPPQSGRIMARKSPGRLRGPATPKANYQALSSELQRFVKDNISRPAASLNSMRSSEPSPDRPRVQAEDLLVNPARSMNSEFNGDPGSVREVHGPVCYQSGGPAVKVLHSAEAHSPGPGVHSVADMSQHAYHRAGDNKLVIPGMPAGARPEGTGPVVS